jgi:low temperature requirement protein LtrA
MIESETRTATWLELFYDLAYVAVIAKMVHHLPEYTNDLTHYFMGLAIFIPIWWCWAGHTYFANRFERDDTFQVITALIQLFAVTVLITSINPLFEGSPTQFIVGYFIIRLLLVFMYVREWRINQENKVILRNLTVGFGLGAIVWVSSLLFESAALYAVLALSILIEIIVLALNSKSLKAYAKTHAEHLAERTGLLTIIMLGEVVVSLVVFLENSTMTIENVVLCSTGFTLLALMWWLYFRVSEPLIEDNPILDSQIHGYSNLFTFLSIIILSTAIASWGIKEQSTIIWLTASAVSLFVVTLQIILGKNPLYYNRLVLNAFRYSYCFIPIAIAVISLQVDMSILLFNTLIIVWLFAINYTNNFTKFITVAR